MTRRRAIIAQALKKELGSQARVGLSGLDALDLEAVAAAIDDAITRNEHGEPGDEGTRPQDLSSANDG